MKRKLNRLWRQATADKKKFGMLVTVLAVGLLLWGRLILLEKVPRHATADPGAQPAPQATQASPQPVEDLTAAPVLPPLEEVRVDLSDRLTLDLFAFRHNRYRLLPLEKTGDLDIQTDNQGDDVKVRLAALVRDLRLQSVIRGASPKLSRIVINGKVLRVGDSIEGFEIVSFDERSAKVTRGGLTFTLNMLSEINDTGHDH